MADLPYRVDKPWGHELIWAQTDRYVGKILHVKAGQTLSRQYHNVKDETLYLMTGRLVVSLQAPEGPEERQVVEPGTSIRIRPKVVHEMEAVLDSDVLEASTAELDDLVRLKDRYGRA